VGRSTARKLAAYGIKTIGDIAAAAPDFLKRLLGVAGVGIWAYASGKATSRVTHMDYEAPIKSIGHGITCTEDLVSSEEVFLVMLQLSQEVGRKLRQNGFLARGVQISVRDNGLNWKQYQTQFEIPTQSPTELAGKGVGFLTRITAGTRPSGP
jgi:DNA polymerase-4